jgi:hypothetical protein
LEENSNIQDEIMRLFGEAGAENFSIMEEQIDIDLQMEYFEFAGNLKESVEIVRDDIISDIPKIFLKETDIHFKKKTLILLATIDSPEAYRAIEKFSNTNEGELKEWAKIALHESRMLLHSSYLGEHQVFISTGLGGKGVNLRYCVVLLAKSKSGFDNTQKKVINNEFEIHLSQIDGILESVEFNDENVIVMCLIPVTVAIRDFFVNLIRECNNFGDFIKSDFIVTNVKKLQNNDIEGFLKNHKNPAKSKREIK